MNKDTELIRFDGVDVVQVYTGGMTHLEKADLKWRDGGQELSRLFGFKAEILTLGEIEEQLGDRHLITIVIEGPLSGEIWQYGNYTDDTWYKIGTLRGYA